MWQKCDFHRHTIPDDGSDDFTFDPVVFLQGCVSDGLDVVAVTDHDRTDHIDAVLEEASNHDVVVVPGVEISTDRGHVLALAPGIDGTVILEELRSRVPLEDGQADFQRLIGALGEQRVNSSDLFRRRVILIGAHADRPASILGPSQSRSIHDQISAAQQLQGLEVVKPENLGEWRAGIKQTDVAIPLLQGSDAHPTVEHKSRWTWMYLPEVTTQWLRHALATREASVFYSSEPPSGPEFWIKSIQFEGDRTAVGESSSRRGQTQSSDRRLRGSP